jgi:hypothetical protein
MFPCGRGVQARWLAMAFALAMIAGCATISQALSDPAPVAGPVAEKAKFEQDRQAILAMAGNYQVTFDFREITPIAAGYQLKKPKATGGDEIIRLVEDRGTFISLQHLLVVGEGDDKAVVKHWRQDWTYEPASVLVFIGGNAWERRAVSAKDRAGKWSQVVYQVEDSPRYGAVGAWSHANGVSQWTPPAEMKPLPRRDMTTRDDYDAILAVNRHVITPFGWVQEEDNSKLSLTGKPQVLVREIGVNTYRRSDKFDVKFGDDYWNATKDFWALVRADWSELEKKDPKFGLTMQGEPAALYNPMLELADDVQAGKKTAAAAAAEAKQVVAKFTTADVGTLADRFAKKRPLKQASAGSSVVP